eukprot:12770078-Ditylum_brightwellii.AAC.1
MGPLGRDEKGPGPQRQHQWQYAFVVGMMMYLASNSRPDIAFAVHQCACFTHCVRASHEKAILRICKYLKGTWHKGLIMRPNCSSKVECYVDADFASLYGAENPEDPICVKSRMGYLIKFSECPFLWVSKLQTEIALSILHSEYVMLSQSLRDLLPTKDLLQETFSKISLPEEHLKSSPGGYQPRMTPISKFIAVKYHWFQRHVDSGEVSIVKVSLQEQEVDMFTKGLQGKLFFKIQMLVCGW